MLKIVKNKGQCKNLPDNKYIFCAKFDGDIMYANIGIKPIIGYFVYPIWRTIQKIYLKIESKKGE